MEAPGYDSSSCNGWANDVSVQTSQRPTPPPSIGRAIANTGNAVVSDGSHIDVTDFGLSSPCPNSDPLIAWSMLLPPSSSTETFGAINHDPFELEYSQLVFNQQPPPLFPSQLISEERPSSVIDQPESATIQARRLKRQRSGRHSSMDYLEPSPETPVPRKLSNVMAVADKTRNLIRTWVDAKGLRSSTENLAKSVELEHSIVIDLISEELQIEARNSSPLMPTPISPLNASSPTSPATIAALNNYSTYAAQRSCDDLQRRRRKNLGSYQCTSKECNYRTRIRESWHRHMDVRQPRIIYICDDCLAKDSNPPFSEHRKDKFREHVKKIHGKSSPALLDVERKSQHHQRPSNPLHCGFCNRKFTTHEDYRDHVMGHFTEKKPDGEEWNVQNDWREHNSLQEIHGAESSSTKWQENTRTGNFPVH
ncbi:MAG: hypothetical protein M1821_003714 [Bathelium mastoideum]|nr:MAG: hypothetical protein M1821_003714 [Bathelium mastoideum]KAI9690797.1 MAG: hypothetical protein M1822_008416 [Bathelium mastoideum]